MPEWRRGETVGLNILLVPGKNEEEWNRAASYLARRKGAALTPASGAADAARHLLSEDINIVLADYNLPRVSGINFLRRMKALKPSVEVIFLSDPATLSKAIEVMKEGAYDFYEFPVNLRLLMTVIEKASEKQALYVEKQELEEQVRERYEFENIMGRSKPMRHVLGLVRSVAPKNVNVLIAGETGTGKELIASAIHYHSPRSNSPFIRVNCAAFSEGVLESELFGHEKGAFTGAMAQRIGRFELAHGGTLFLDEIGDLTPGTQAKLLRVLQEREFERVGGNETIRADVRVIAATNRNLRHLVEERSFREDLYYRLNVVHLELPPLRERKEDIPLLVSFFINRLNEEKGYDIKGITRDVMHVLLNYRWPGNVRELVNALESAMALSKTQMIEAKYLPAFLLLASPEESDYLRLPKDITLKEAEAEVIRAALLKTQGNRTRAARLLGIGLRTLQRKLKEGLAE
jgi:DNA-binding NtrC family response regulator